MFVVIKSIDFEWGQPEHFPKTMLSFVKEKSNKKETDQILIFENPFFPTQHLNLNSLKIRVYLFLIIIVILYNYEFKPIFNNL